MVWLCSHGKTGTVVPSADMSFPGKVDLKGRMMNS